jgi:hypothetical protein
MDFEVFISSEKMTCFSFILSYEFKSVHVNLILKEDSKIHFVIIIISSVFVIILQNLKVHFCCNISFCTFLAHPFFPLNLDTIPLIPTWYRWYEQQWYYFLFHCQLREKNVVLLVRYWDNIKFPFTISSILFMHCVLNII